MCIRDSLSLEEAWRFLATDAPLLKEAGVQLLLPAEGRTTKPSLRLNAAESRWKSGVAVTRFGLGTLVDFDWRVAVGDQLLSPEEFEQLATRKVPLVEVRGEWVLLDPCLLYTSDAADERSSVDLGGRRIIKKKKKIHR